MNTDTSIHQDTESSTPEKTNPTPELPPTLLELVANQEKYEPTSSKAANAGEKSAEALWRFLRLGEQVVEVCCFDAGTWAPEGAKPKSYKNCITYATSAGDAYYSAPRTDQGESKNRIWPTGYYIVPARLRDSGTAKYPHDSEWHAAKTVAKEDDVTQALVLSIDVDTDRSDATNATTTERNGALPVAWRIRQQLMDLEAPEGSLGLGMSGNGYQLLLALDIPWSATVKSQRVRLLAALGAKHETAAYKIDTTMVDGSRYIPLFGTLKRKGPQIKERVWRRTWFVGPEKVEPLDGDAFESLVSAVEASVTPDELEKYKAKKSKGKTVAAATVKVYNSRDDNLGECSAVDVAVVARILGIDPTNPKCPHPNCGAEGSPSDDSVEHIPEKNIIKCLHGSCSATAWTPIRLVQNDLGVGDLKGNKEGVAKVIDWFVEHGLVNPPEKRGRKPKSYTVEELERRASRHLSPRVVAEFHAQHVTDYDDKDPLLEWMQGGCVGEMPEEGEEGEASATAWTYGIEEHDSLAAVRRPLTDAGNAERLMDLYGEDCRYVVEWGKWIVWTGKVWEVDRGSLKVARFALKTVRAINKEAILTDPKERGAVAGWAHKSEESARLSAMLKLAAPMAAVAASRLDQDPWILNCSNGTLKLKTGELREHERRDYITRVATVEYDPNADTTLVDAFLARVQPDAEVREYLWRLLGYSLTGDVGEQLMAVHHGAGGANGKSTLLGAVSMILGEYATDCPESLLVGDGKEHPTVLTTLRGARFALASETERSDRLRVALVKRLTGGDRITARGMNEDFWTFSPSHKLHLITNNRPGIPDGTDPIWRRLQLIPWAVTIPEGDRDPGLGGKLSTDRGLLRRMVEGCVDYVRGGMRVPAFVKAATNEYREDSDEFGDFLEERIESAAGVVSELQTLYNAYVSWMEGRNNRPLKRTNFAVELRKRKIGEEGKDSRTRRSVLRGVRVIPMGGDECDSEMEALLGSSGDDDPQPLLL